MQCNLSPTDGGYNSAEEADHSGHRNPKFFSKSFPTPSFPVYQQQGRSGQYLLSTIYYLLSTIYYLLSTIYCLSSVHWPECGCPHGGFSQEMEEQKSTPDLLSLPGTSNMIIIKATCWSLHKVDCHWPGWGWCRAPRRARTPWCSWGRRRGRPGRWGGPSGRRGRAGRRSSPTAAGTRPTTGHTGG